MKIYSPTSIIFPSGVALREYDTLGWYCIHWLILYIHCMLVREICKFIHPRVSYSLRATPEGIMVLVGVL
jgi:hypothetical protein